MPNFPKNLQAKLDKREENKAFRSIPNANSLIDFSSNDYLGFAQNDAIYANTFQLMLNEGITKNGATGSRLLTGNYKLYNDLEEHLTTCFNADEALIFNSGYAANLGFFSAVPQRGDVILYDEYIHASIRDGIQLSNAKSYKFKHNDLSDLEQKCKNHGSEGEIYIATESVFSMDGDMPDFKTIIQLKKKFKIHLVVDEAHAIGVFGDKGEGVISSIGIEKEVFAKIITFGKGLGSHGAAILGCKSLKNYLINFARSFIYTTAMPPHSLATTKASLDYCISEEGQKCMKKLKENITFFNEKLKDLKIDSHFIPSVSPIHCCIIPGNAKVKKVAEKLQEKGFGVYPILSPTVPKGEERLRICLHNYNAKEEIGLVLQILSSQLKYDDK